jgi:hypothetical protein
MSLLFQNESNEVVRKAQKKYASAEGRQRIPSHQTKASRDSQENQITAYQPPVAVPQQLSQPLHDQAACFVHRNYMEKWLWLYSAPMKEERNQTLTSAITALGLAVLANIRMSPPLMMAAREEYIAALGNTNRSLRDPVDSKTNQTLLAVMFLGIFEVRSPRPQPTCLYIC